MNRFILLYLTIILTIFVIAFISSCNYESNATTPMPSPINDYTEDWKQVQKFESKGLTQDARKVVERIRQKAKLDKNAPQNVKALLYLYKYTTFTEENSEQSIVQDIQKEIKVANSPTKSILQSILADLYWQYFQHNRYQILKRTEVASGTPTDFQTWDINRLTKEITRLHLAALQPASELKSKKVDNYKAIVSEVVGSDELRPTLYDFLAHRALDYFKNDQANITKASDQFELDSEAAFSNSKTFSSTKFENTDSLSIKYYAIQILQELVGTHYNNSDIAPLIDVEIERLQFAKQTSTLANKDELYIKALEDLQKNYNNNPATANVSYEIAKYYYDLGNQYNTQNEDTKEKQFLLKKALDIAENAIDNYPPNRGTKNCDFVKTNILNKNFQFTLENTQLPNQAFRALVNYKNVFKTYWQIHKIDEATEEKINNFQEEKDKINFFRKLPVLKEQTLDMPDLQDFQSHRLEAKLPALPIGKYLVMASTSPDFVYKKEALAYQITTVTNLSFLTRKNDLKTDFFVLHRDSGQPLANVNYELFQEKYNYKRRKHKLNQLATGKTDTEGSFSYRKNGEHGRFKVVLQQGDDKLGSYLYLNSYHRNKDKKRDKTFFFTDRSIYRPGQTVYFKGLMLNTYKEQNSLLVNENTKVTLYDVNGQKVKELSFKTNQYGTFNGKFELPTGLLNGSMRISNQSGNAYFQVEEYKRPKFEVVFKPVKGSYRLNEQVKVSAQAKAYAGSNIDNAEVKYRVVRRASFPYYFGYWWRPMPSSPEKVITNGTATTNEKGEFDVIFTALPDKSISKDRKPQYTYVVYADVTDINGETQSKETSVSVGYISLLANVAMEEKISRTGKKEFAVKTTNLGGEFEAADVSITIHELQQPERIFRDRKWEQPDQFVMDQREYYAAFPHDIYKDENQFANWEKGKKVFEKQLTTTKDSKIILEDLPTWEAGKYLVELHTKDKYGEKVEWKKYITLHATDDEKVPLNEVFWHSLSTQEAEPGEVIEVYYGSAAPDTKILLELEHKGKIIERQWLSVSKQQQLTNIKVKEAYRGNFAIHLSLVKYNQFITKSYNITVPWSNKELNIEVLSLRNKLAPGQDEEWQLKITGPKSEQVAAEMLTGMYDASLDVFRSHAWPFNIYPTNGYLNRVNSDSGFNTEGARLLADKWNDDYRNYYNNQGYSNLNWFGFHLFRHHYARYAAGGTSYAMSSKKSARNRSMPMSAPPAPMMKQEAAMDMASAEAVMVEKDGVAGGAADTVVEQKESRQEKEKVDFGDVQIRKNLQETAFFFPDLKTNAKGEILLSFKAPEALTKWKLLGFAHSKDLKFAHLTKEIITQKDLMVMPNPPRFFRENDEIYFSTKITNLTKEALNGTAALQLFDALTMEAIDAKLGNSNNEQSFTAAAEQSTAVSWKLTIPEGIQAVHYKVLAKAGKVSDGEENALPVLTNKMLVTESLPLSVRSKQSKTFKFENLAKAEQSNTLRHQRLTLEFSSQPAWYAVQALPYMMEYPYECAEQIFSRYYANSIASHVANSNPKIKKVFNAWKDEAVLASKSDSKEQASALLSNLEKNQELKSLLLEETPWVMAAKNEGERKKRLGLLFDIDKMASEKKLAEKKLREMQVSSGGWPWFPEMRESEYITRHIVAGMGHLDVLGIKTVREDNQTWSMVSEAVRFLDDRMKEDYKELKKSRVNLDDRHIGHNQVHYLYSRSYFKDVPVPQSHKEAFNYWLEQAETYWLNNNKYTQGMIALALHRFTNKDSKVANEILKSLKQNATHNEEMGMYFKGEQRGWFWYQAPIETQALLIEAFDEVAGDKESVEAMKIWLLKQKQTQDWKTTKATAEACYALLMRGTDFLSQDALVDIQIGSQKIDPNNLPEAKAEAGTGYFKTAWSADDITADMGNITVEKKDEGVSWGAVYWQYFEQLDKITAAETPLSIKKELFLVEDSKSGQKLNAISDKGTLKVGDKVKVRIELRVDRAMEYVHMKDMRAAGFEPINVISRYRYQDGLGYYETTKDAATNFFISYLNKGTYVFEYPLRVAQKGDFSNGITSIQCMYAPEFSSHSEGIRVTVD